MVEKEDYSFVPDSSHNILSNADELTVVGVGISSSVVTNTAIGSSSHSDIAALRELVPSASEEEIGNALVEFGGLNSAANSLLGEKSAATSFVENVEVLGKKLTGKRKKLEADQDDLIHDAVAFYRSSSFDACSPLRVAYKEQPAIRRLTIVFRFSSTLTFDGFKKAK